MDLRFSRDKEIAVVAKLIENGFTLEATHIPCNAKMVCVATESRPVVAGRDDKGHLHIKFRRKYKCQKCNYDSFVEENVVYDKPEQRKV